MKPRFSSSYEIDSIVKADCHDPFSILGIHPAGSNKRDLIIRVFHPEWEEVVVSDKFDKVKKWRMNKVDPEGFFELYIKDKNLFAYYLNPVTWKGESFKTRDPYSFLPTLGELDLHLFNEGNHFKIDEKLGAHKMIVDGTKGVRFALWAPSAKRVSVIGPFSNWDGRVYQMRSLGSSGVWEIFIPNLGDGTLYKFEIKSEKGEIFSKTDPYGYSFELRPKNAAIVSDQSSYEWSDQNWMKERETKDPFKKPINIYELHLGSWARENNNADWLSYRKLAYMIADYCNDLGYTDVELMPITEFPFDGSWGYQATGYFAPTSRFGTPDDFKAFVDILHNNNIGVIIDWVPAHFPKDREALRNFSGQPTYEHEHPYKGEHPDWGTNIFDYGRREVANFLISSALFWFEHYHVDGIRVDAVASMIYLDYSRKDGEWIPNQYGGKENLDAIDFLRKLNSLVHEKFKGAITIAEESTSFAGVSRPAYIGGLGFTFKWNMGWMHDILEYFSKDPVHRKYHHNDLTFAMLYNFSENFILSISHDEVVHHKRSLISKMPGDLWQKFANLRTFLAYMYTFPGKKLLFMGADIGQFDEWNYDKSLDWHLLEYKPHALLQNFIRKLFKIYKTEKSLFELDHDSRGFEWIDCNDSVNSTISFARKAENQQDYLICIFNMTPIVRSNYRIGVYENVALTEILNSDRENFYGSNIYNHDIIQPESIRWHGKDFSVNITLPPLSAVILKPVRT